MKNKILTLMILTFIYNVTAFTTEYPVVDPLSTEWQEAGLTGDIPVHHSEMTIDAGDVTDIQSIINDIPDATINNIYRIILPPGEFNLTESINLKSYIILKGNHQFRRDEDRAQRTILKFDLTTDANCINVNGSESAPIEYVGIEDLWIIREDNISSEHSYTGINMHLKHSSNCWVIGVESTMPVTNHLRMINSDHNYVTGCYFNNAQGHGEGGEGYGVFIEYDSHHILVENNIFKKLRHSMVVQNGAHHNVFGYNTVKKSKNTSIEDWGPAGVAPWMEAFARWIMTSIVPKDYTGDLLCHGESSQHYGGTYEGPYENLFEGNVCNSIQVDSFWGQNKKHNTFFRNKSSKYGIAVYPKLEGSFDIQNESEKQTEQITINNYCKSRQHWTDAGPLYMTGGGVTALGAKLLSFIPEVGPQLAFEFILYGLKTTIDYANFGYKLTNGRGFDVKPIEKNNIVKRMNFWGNYYTRTWTDDDYGSDSKAWDDESYYRTDIPDFWATSLTSSWPYHPKNSESTPSEYRYNTFEKKTVSRYDDTSFLQTYYITESVNIDDLTGDLYSNGNLNVPVNTLLIIDSSSSDNGITLSFGQFKVFSVAGSVIIKGSQDKPVTLTSRWNSQFSEWFGVLLGTATSSEYGDAFFEWVIFEKAANRNGSSSGIPASYTENLGGAVNIRNDRGKEGFTVTFNNCTFRDNVSRNPLGGYHDQTGRGAAVYLNSQDQLNTIDVLFSNCRFINNTANGVNTFGGAIYARGNAPTIENCYFENNHATSGGAICINKIYDTRTNFIAGNVFYSNSATNGGALYLSHSDDSSSIPTTVFHNNTFVQNTASYSGGGALVRFNDNQIIFKNNLFWDNDALGDPDVYGEGNSILIIVDSDALDYPDIIFESNSIEGFDLIDDPFNDYVSYARFIPFSFCNMELNYIAVNNIYSNPLLYDNYKIDYTSTCLDSGYLITEDEDDYMYYSLSHDVDGENRIAGQSIDIGAYEYNDIHLMPSINEIVLGNINPDSPREFKFEILNTSDNTTISNITLDVSEDLGDVLVFDSHLNELNPNSSMTIIGNFYPSRMYKTYNGFISIKSDNIMSSDISIPFSANTHIHSAWNWVSFPTVSGSMNNSQLFETIDPYGISVMYKNDYATLDNNGWSVNGLDTIYSSAFYKINMVDYSKQYDIPFDMGNSQTSITLYPNVDNWVGYWLDESKNMRDAFGDNFDKVTSMKSEKWSYAPIPINPKKDINIPTPPSWKTHTLHKGRGYVVRVSETIQGFTWGDSGTYYSKKGSTPKLIHYESQATDDYMVMDIINIDDSTIEIGAFQEDVCIGAAAVVDNQAQLLLYPTIERDNNLNLRIEFVSENRIENVDDLYVYDFKKNDFDISYNIILDQPYYLVSFNDPNSENNVLNPMLQLYNNYPNPFNPETNISFDIPCDSDVKLEIYNIKGQKVKTLADKRLSAGSHSIVWNGTNSNNKSVASGVYFYKLRSDNKELTKKMVLLK